jgi:Uncharacterized conserved protein
VEIDTSAPAVARGEIEIAAPPEIVWRVLTDIANWPSWNPDIKSVSLEGPLAAGTRFRWKAGPGTITSTLQTVDPPRRIDWTGKTFGIKAVESTSSNPATAGRSSELPSRGTASRSGSSAVG